MSLLEEAVARLVELIAFPTVSADSNLELIAYAAARLDSLGARTELSLDEGGTKANLFATLGPEVDGGVVLSGHTDVVPVEGQDWSTDPFEADLRDGRIYGRGACDMKGFIACALAMAPRFAESDLTRPVHFAFTFDEEVGCLGARVLLAQLAQHRLRPGVCLIGEPTGMRIVEGHKGCYEYSTQFLGQPGHASDPAAGVNAIEYAVRYIHTLLELQGVLRDRAPPGSRFAPPWSTLQVGRIDGGIARNVIAEHCTVDWEFRPVSRADVHLVREAVRSLTDDTLLPQMRAVFPGAAIDLTVVGEVDGLEPMGESEAIALARALTGSDGLEVTAFGTEAGLYQQLGISTVVCGPGSIEQAHRADEFVELEQLEACLGMMERLALRLEAAGERGAAAAGR